MAAQFVSAGTQAYVIGNFLKPMTQELGWSRADFSAVQTVSTFVSGAFGIVIGVLIDRRGPRALMLVGGLIAGVALACLSQVQTLWQFYLLRGVVQTIGIALIGNLVVNVTVAKWFVSRRGMAVAIASLGVSLGGVVLTPLTAWWVDAYGWRTAWTLLGIVVACLVLPSSLLMRRAPEDCGLMPDGMSLEEAAEYSASSKNRVSTTSEVQWTRRDAVRTRTIWLVIGAYGTATIGMGAMLLHMVPYLTDAGFSKGAAGVLFSLMAWSALLSKPLWGMLMDSFHARFLSALGFGVAAVAIFTLLFAARTQSEVAVAIVLGLYGFSVGGTVPLQETVWASYFGRMHLGEIRSVAMPFSIIFSAGGPLLAGDLYDRTGSYQAAFLIFAAFSLVGMMLVLLAKPPALPHDALALAPALGGIGTTTEEALEVHESACCVAD